VKPETCVTVKELHNTSQWTSCDAHFSVVGTCKGDTAQILKCTFSPKKYYDKEGGLTGPN
jgi:hypothetical protein